LGPGYAALVTEGAQQRLLTLTRDGEDEVLVALDSATGKTIWETRYKAPVEGLRGVDTAYGNAPQATPLLADGRVFALGFTGKFHAFDAASGDILWAKDLARLYRAKIPYFGHASSPLLVVDPEDPERTTVVVLAAGALAFDPATGDLRWRNSSFESSYSSPILAETAFGRQIIAAAAGEIVGLDPETGESLWRHEYVNPQRTSIGTPILVKEDLLFVSVYFVGSRGLRLVARDRGEVAWEQPDFQVSHFNAVLQEGLIFTTYKNNLVALDGGTGEILWKERRFGSANLLKAGKQTFLFGESGKLTSAHLDRSGIEVLQTARILEERSWTPPTVVGNRFFVRDQRIVAAHDLSSARSGEGAKIAATSRPAKVAAPVEFRQLIEQLHGEVLRSEVEGAQETIEKLSAWAADPRLGTWAAYHRAFGLWQLIYLSEEGEQLGFLDRAVEEAKQAVELDRRNAEAHALLGSLYPTYYRMNPQRAAVVGYLGGEHLSRALELEPDNPRVRAIHGLDLAYSPPAWGGDPVAGRKLLKEGIEGFGEGEAAPPEGARPFWGSGLVRTWFAQLLLSRDPKDPAQARRLLEEAAALYPEMGSALSMLASMAPEGPKA